MVLNIQNFVKQNILYILCFFLVLFLLQLVSKHFTYTEGFTNARMPLTIAPATGNQVLNSRGKSGSMLYWIGDSKTMPDATYNSVISAIERQRNIEEMFKNPGYYIRLDWKTQIPYTDVNFENITSIGNNCEPEFEMKEITMLPYMKGYKYFTVKPDWIVNTIRSKCNIQVTPQLLGKFPKMLQDKWIDTIFNMQKEMIRIKRIRIADSGGNCQTRRNFADNFFSPELRSAHENRIAKEKEQLQVDSLQNIKQDANTTLNDLANASGTSPSKILDNASTRSALKGQLAQPTSNIRKAVLNQARPSPYAVVNTALKAAGIDIITDSFKAIVKVLSGDPFAGTECPPGFVEIDQINTDPTFQKMSEIFPNPFSDFVNIGATTKACAKYEAGKAPEVKQKICRTEYVDEPTRMTALQTTPPTPACEMDRDINKKLKLIADWVAGYSIEKSNRVTVIDSFTYVWAPTEYFLEAIFTISTYSKEASFQKKDAYGRILKTPDEYTREARFYFTKNGCSYSVLGFNNGNLTFLYQNKVDGGVTLSYSPPPGNEILLWLYAIENNIPNPSSYVKQNLKNNSVLNTVQQKNAARDAQEAADIKERQDLLSFLNPSNNAEIAFSLSKANLAELRERKQIFESYPGINRNFPYTIELLRKEKDKQKDKTDIINLFVPDKNPQVLAIYANMTMDELNLMKTAGKEARDAAMKILNPTNELAKRLELEKLQTGSLQALVTQKASQDSTIAIMNPSKNPQTETVLRQLDFNALNARYIKWKERESFMKYFNPTDSESITTRLLEIPVAELQERMNLIKQLSPKDTQEIQNLNLLTLEELQKRVTDLTKPLNDVKAFFNPDKFADIDAEIAKYPLADLQERMRLLKKLQQKNASIRGVDFMQFRNTPSKYPNSRIRSDYSFLGINWDS